MVAMFVEPLVEPGSSRLLWLPPDKSQLDAVAGRVFGDDVAHLSP